MNMPVAELSQQTAMTGVMRVRMNTVKRQGSDVSAIVMKYG